MATVSNPLQELLTERDLARITKRSVASVRRDRLLKQDHGYSVPEADQSAPQGTHDDDDETTGTEYASGKDELKAIYFAKSGEQFKIADLDAIETLLVCTGVSWEAFAADVRGHSWDRIKNPVGFLKNRAKNFRAINRTSSAPVTAAEAAAKNYRCPTCFSVTKGEGAVPAGPGKWAPCSCASPEWIAAQRARGVFPPEIGK